MSDRLIDVTGGYGTVYKNVLKDKDLSIEAKAIYSYLTAYAGGKDVAFPSVNLICHELNISERRFYKHRKELLDKGIINKSRERTESGFSKTIYTINHHLVHGHFVRVQNVHGQNVHVQNVHVQNVGTKNNNTKNNNIKNNNTKNNNSRVDHGAYKEIIEYLNKETDKHFNFKAKANQELIKARFNEGYEKADFFKVIDNKVSEWLDVDKMKDYLQPSTLFRKSNFDKYLNQTVKQPTKEANVLDKLMKEE